MNPLLPPLFRGKIPTTPARLLLAAAVMFAIDIPVISFFTFAGLLFHFTQVLLVIGVLLLSARRWVAALLLLAISLGGVAWYGIPADAAGLTFLAFALIPLWVGTFIAYPRPRKRWVYVEEGEEEDKARL